MSASGSRAAGTRPGATRRHHVRCYRAPDLNTVEVLIDNSAAPKDTIRYMYGAEYTADPGGPSFAPDATLAALRSRTSADKLAT